MLSSLQFILTQFLHPPKNPTQTVFLSPHLDTKSLSLSLSNFCIYPIMHASRNWLFSLSKSSKIKGKKDEETSECISRFAEHYLCFSFLSTSAFSYQGFHFAFNALSPCLFVCICLYNIHIDRFWNFYYFIIGFWKIFCFRLSDSVFVFFWRALIGNGKECLEKIRLWALFPGSS